MSMLGLGVRDSMRAYSRDHGRSKKVAASYRNVLLSQRALLQSCTKSLDVWEAFDRVPGFYRPTHLKPYVDQLEQACDREVRVVLHAPSQHFKTTTTLVTLAHFAETRSGLTHLYLTYSSTRAKRVMNEFQGLLVNMGIKHTRTGDEFRFDGGKSLGGTTIFFSSVGSFGAGQAINGVVIIDDPFKDMEAASSGAVNEGVWDWFRTVLLQRKIGRLSIVVMATRWTENDLSGRILAEFGWPYIRLAALCDDPATDPLGRSIGEPLCPTAHSNDDLITMRRMVGERVWFAMYVGRPAPSGGYPFKAPQRYVDRPWCFAPR